LTWRNVGRALFYAPAVLLGIPAIIILPFVDPSTFRFAQLGMFLLFVVGVKGDIGLGRYGDVFERHQGPRRLADHALHVALIALAFTMALSAGERLFSYCWWFLSFGLVFVYFSMASPWMRRWRAERLEQIKGAEEASGEEHDLHTTAPLSRPSALAEEDER
jgi:hypothetical protein